MRMFRRNENSLAAVARVAVVAGAAGSIGLMLYAGRRAPRLLIVLFTIWVLSPFMALLWANIVSKPWPVVTRLALYCVTPVIALSSLGIYGYAVLRSSRSTPTAVFVAVPPASSVLMTIAVAGAALLSRKRPH